LATPVRAHATTCRHTIGQIAPRSPLRPIPATAPPVIQERVVAPAVDPKFAPREADRAIRGATGQVPRQLGEGEAEGDPVSGLREFRMRFAPTCPHTQGQAPPPRAVHRPSLLAVDRPGEGLQARSCRGGRGTSSCSATDHPKLAVANRCCAGVP
jgi:hypothetical protein